MVTIRDKSDASIEVIASSLEEYERQHPGAQSVLYRQNSASIRVRIVDEDFKGISKADRHNNVWSFFQDLSEDLQSQISLLILLTPAELDTSFANADFDHPIPSRL